MRRESASTGHYRAVIDDLRARRDELDQLIASLEAMVAVGGPEENYGKSTRRTHAREEVTESLLEEARSRVPSAAPPLPFSLVGMPDLEHRSIGDACVAVLRHAAKPLTNRDIVNVFEEIKYEVRGNVANNVGSALYHRNKTRGDVARTGSRHWVYVAPKEEETKQIPQLPKPMHFAGGGEAKETLRNS